MDGIINACDSRLERCHEYLENIGRHEVAQDINIVLEDLYRLRQHYDVVLQQHNIALHSLRKELANQKVTLDNERKGKDDARKLAQYSSRKVDQLETAVAVKDTSIVQLRETLASKNISIAKLNRDIEREKANTRTAYTQGLNAGQQAAKIALSQGPQDTNEELIERSLQRGRQAFDIQDFGVAKGFLRDGMTKFDQLSFDRRKRYNTTKLHYQLAVCGAYSEGINKAKDSLITFLNHSTACTTKEDMLFVAHVQHLLAQVHIGCGNLRQATSVCEQSERTRRQLLPQGSNPRHQTIALRARLLELERRERDAELLRESISGSSREILRQMYSQLKPLGKDNVKSGRPLSQSVPATELLPIWTMTLDVPNTPLQPPKQVKKPAKPVQAPSTPEPRAVDVMLRQSRLSNLMLTPPHASTMSSSLKKALILGDKQMVASILAKEVRVSAPALHMVALFGDVEVAKLVVARGVPVNGLCNCQSEKLGKLVHGVTPMHLAVGAQHGDMVRYLHSVGGSFLASDAGKGNRSSAPPLWLISKRWLNMMGGDLKSVVGVLRIMKKLGWNTNADLNEDGDTMRSLAKKNLTGRIELQSAVLAELDRLD